MTYYQALESGPKAHPNSNAALQWRAACALDGTHQVDRKYYGCAELRWELGTALDLGKRPSRKTLLKLERMVDYAVRDNLSVYCQCAA